MYDKHYKYAQQKEKQMSGKTPMRRNGIGPSQGFVFCLSLQPNHFIQTHRNSIDYFSTPVMTIP